MPRYRALDPLDIHDLGDTSVCKLDWEAVCPRRPKTLKLLKVSCVAGREDVADGCYA